MRVVEKWCCSIIYIENKTEDYLLKKTETKQSLYVHYDINIFAKSEKELETLI